MNEQDRSGQAQPPELAPSGPASTYGTALRLAASLAAVPTALVVTSSAQELRIRAAVGDDAPEVVSGSPLLLQAWATSKPVFSVDAAQLRALLGDAARPWVWCAVVPFGARGDEGALLLIDTVARTLDDAQIGRLTLLGGVLAEVTQLACAAVAHDEHDLQGFFRFADHATNGFAVHRYPNGRPQLEYINAAAAARLGASVEQFSQNPELFFEDPGHVAHALEVLARVRRGDTARHEAQLHRADGTPYWVELAAWPLPADGDVERVLVIATDITEQRSTNEHLRLLSRAIDEAVDFFSISDMTPASEGGPLIRYANPALLHLTGYTSDELYGRPYTMLLAPTNSPNALATLAANMEQRIMSSLELLLRAKDGHDVWCEFVAQPITDSSGEFKHWLAVGRDISLRKQAQNQIALLMTAMDNLEYRIVIYEVGEDGTLEVSYENAAAFARGRYRLKELFEVHDSAAGVNLRARLQAHQEVRTWITDSSDPAIGTIELDAKAIVNAAGGIEAIISMERDAQRISPAEPHVFPAVRVISLIAATQGMIDAPDAGSRLQILRTTLRDVFQATLRIDPAADGPIDTLQLDIPKMRAQFWYEDEGLRCAKVAWESTLGESALTSLRLCIETFLTLQSRVVR